MVFMQEREAAEAKFGGSESMPPVAEANGHVETDEAGAQQDEDMETIDGIAEQAETGRLCSSPCFFCVVKIIRLTLKESLKKTKIDTQ